MCISTRGENMFALSCTATPLLPTTMFSVLIRDKTCTAKAVRPTKITKKQTDQIKEITKQSNRCTNRIVFRRAARAELKTLLTKPQDQAMQQRLNHIKKEAKKKAAAVARAKTAI